IVAAVSPDIRGDNAAIAKGGVERAIGIVTGHEEVGIDDEEAARGFWKRIRDTHDYDRPEVVYSYGPDLSAKTSAAHIGCNESTVAKSGVERAVGIVPAQPKAPGAAEN